jgi:hypothetical protein
VTIRELYVQAGPVTATLFLVLVPLGWYKLLELLFGED